MTDAAPAITEAESELRDEAAAAAEQIAAQQSRPPMLFVTPGDQMLLEPISAPGPAGEAVPAVRITVRNAIGGATCVMAADSLDEHIRRCQELRSAMQGPALYVPPAPALVVAPAGAHA
jgi:hypothetical protein